MADSTRGVVTGLRIGSDMAKRLQKLRDKIAADGFEVIAEQMQIVADVMADANKMLGDDLTKERLRETRRVTQVARHLERIHPGRGYGRDERANAGLVGSDVDRVLNHA